MSSDPTVRVLLVEDHAMVARGIEAWEGTVGSEQLVHRHQEDLVSIGLIDLTVQTAAAAHAARRARRGPTEARHSFPTG